MALGKTLVHFSMKYISIGLISYRNRGMYMIVDRVNTSSGFTDTQEETVTGSIFGSTRNTALLAIIIIIIVILLAGGNIFGGYGNYSGYGGTAYYGYRPKFSDPHRYNHHYSDDMTMAEALGFD
jgi:hypothetical protein